MGGGEEGERVGKRGGREITSHATFLSASSLHSPHHTNRPITWYGDDNNALPCLHPVNIGLRSFGICSHEHKMEVISHSPVPRAPVDMLSNYDHENRLHQKGKVIPIVQVSFFLY